MYSKKNLETSGFDFDNKCVCLVRSEVSGSANLRPASNINMKITADAKYIHQYDALLNIVNFLDDKGCIIFKIMTEQYLLYDKGYAAVFVVKNKRQMYEYIAEHIHLGDSRMVSVRIMLAVPLNNYLSRKDRKPLDGDQIKEMIKFMDSMVDQGTSTFDILKVDLIDVNEHFSAI